MRRLLPGLLLALCLPACGDGDPEGTLRASGTIEVTEVRVGARLPGTLQRIAEEGAAVRAGDTLAVIDHTALGLQLRQAEAVAQAAAARLALLRRGARAEDVAQARALVAQARLALEQAQADVARFRTLAAAGSATAKQHEDAETRLALAQVQHEAAQQGLRKLEDLARPEELQAAAAQLRQAEAGIALLQHQIGEATLTAPHAGTVIEKTAEAGEFIGPGMPVATLADLSRASLRIYVPETALGSLHLGQPVEVFSDADPGTAVAGRVAFISPRAEFTPKNVQTREERVRLVYAVRIDIPNPDGRLKPGLYADAVLRLDEAPPR